MLKKPLNRRLLLVLPVAVCALAALLILYRVDPGQSTHYPRCALHQLTGLHCPGCGSTRAAHALLHGRIWEALRFNPLLVVGIPSVALFAVWRNRRGLGLAQTALATKAILVVVVAYAVARNIPCYPFELLAPPAAASDQPPGGLQSDI